MKNILQKLKHKNQAGFTLLEVIVAVGLFSVTITIVTQIFLLTNKSQREVATIQRVQSDMRTFLGLMVEKVRISNVDYEFSGYASGIANPIETLALLDVDDQEIIFRKSDNVFANTRCPNELSTPCIEFSINGGTTFDSITSDGVRVKELQFLVSPTTDPFDLAATELVQPRVTVRGILESVDVRIEDRVEMPFQTTISARVYKR